MSCSIKQQSSLLFQTQIIFDAYFELNLPKKLTDIAIFTLIIKQLRNGY